MVLALRLCKLSTGLPNLISSRQNGNSSNNNNNKNPPGGLPEVPTTCCMTGCANCVWIEYAEKLSKYFHDGGEEAIKEINENIHDPNLKAFILHELRMRGIKPKQ